MCAFHKREKEKRERKREREKKKEREYICVHLVINDQVE